MIRVNAVQLNSRKYISFGEGNMNNITPNAAILALQAPNAKINFENDLRRSKRADMVQNPNFVTAFVNKVGRAVSEFKRNNQYTEQVHPNICNHINYAA